ncbi:MAG TPA: glycosyltransferase family 4 protein [Chloroflexota bacterium]|jgi:glycosyltransferase involved in cell wall biosynthesis|nr:glycosyltransferase family 4 protein [Chloroflexota bacterium]
MRILAVTNMFPTEKSPQFGIFVDEQANSIRALGHDVDILFFNAREGRLRHKAYVLGFPRLWRTLARNRYDVIHAHYVFSGMIARAQRSAPLVLTHHGPELLDPWQGPICRITRSWADHTIVVAPWMVPELGLSDVHVVPCGVDFALFKPVERQEARTSLGLDTEKRYVLFAGNTWDSRKRFPLVEEAVRILKRDAADVELLTVCGQPHDRIPMFMNAADVFAMASTSEGSAQVVKEAMACNLPVVATDAGDNWDLIAGTEGCFRTGADPSEIAARLADAISPPRRTDGRTNVERFSLDAIARSVVAVYEKAVMEWKCGKTRSDYPMEMRAGAAHE